MTVFQLQVVLEDDYGRLTRKGLETEDISGADVGAEFLAARGFVATFITALQGLTEAQVIAWTLGERVPVSDTATVGANKDEGITISVRKVDNAKAVLKVPAPVNSVINQDGTVDVTDGLITAYTAHFAVGGGFTLSDGENLTEVLSGKLDE